MKALVIIPTYNEKENVKAMIGAVLKTAPEIEVLIVDDDSPDRTWKLVLEMKKRDRRIHLIKNPGKIGLGPAYIVGFSYALKNDYAYIIQMDCDFSHDPKIIPLLLEQAKECGLAIGSRYVRGGKISGWTRKRLILSRMGNLYASLFLGRRIKDWTSGFLCWQERALRSIRFDTEDYPNGYSFLISLKLLALKEGFKPKEIPIVFRDREKGITKMHGGIVNEAVITIIKLRLAKNKKKIEKRF